MDGATTVGFLILYIEFISDSSYDSARITLPRVWFHNAHNKNSVSYNLEYAAWVLIIKHLRLGTNDYVQSLASFGFYFSNWPFSLGCSTVITRMHGFI